MSLVKPERLGAKEKRELISRIVESPHFRRAPRLRDFLLYVADCTLENRPEDAREQAIGERVFNRTGDLYAIDDSIVRTEARNVRKRLEAYFENEGKDEAITVSMPKGRYWLSFEPRLNGLTPANGHVAAETSGIWRNHSSNSSAEAVRQPGGKLFIYRTACLLLAGIAVCTTALAVHWYGRTTQLAGRLPRTQRILPLSAMFDDRRDTLIVCSDTALWKITQLAKRPITLDDYVTRRYPVVPNLSPPDLISNLGLADYTSGYEMAAAGLILKQNARFSDRIFLRSGHQLEIADFRDRDVILLGSPFSNPWAELYTDGLNFQFDLTAGEISFRNLSPRQGERAKYPDSASDEYSYAQIAFMPNISNAGHVLLLAGTNGEATSAAGEFVLDPAQIRPALQALAIDPNGPPKSFELFLRVKSFFGGSTHSTVIASRVRGK